MTVFNHKAFFDAVRPYFGGRLVQRQVDILNKAIDECLAIAPPSSGTLPEPLHLVVARKDFGLKEIPGKDTAPRIVQMLIAVKAGWRDDETAWCGTAMGAWMIAAGLTPPANPWWAANWAKWGVACPAQLGAIGVKKRPGGNHVFLILGETPDKRYYKAFGANQRNEVNIMDVLKAETFAVRWPAGVPQTNLPLPVMAPGPISKDEA